MRIGFLVALLAITSVSVSGCLTTDSVSGDSGAAVTPPSNGGGATEDDANDETASGGGVVPNDGPTQPDDATPNPTVLTGGDITLAFNTLGTTSSAGGFAALEIDNEGVVGETATIAIDPRNAAMLWPEPITVSLFQKGASLGGTYREYRKIDSVTDAELQLWNFDNSYAGQYRVWAGGNTSAQTNLAVFYGGTKTDETAMPTAGIANFAGFFGATATASGWTTFDRTTPDTFATVPAETFDAAAEIAMRVDPNGEWRVTGDINLTADFAAGTVTGQTSNSIWRKFQPDPPEQADPDGYITLTDAEVRNPFPRNYHIDATITGADYSGNVTAAAPIPGGDNAPAVGTANFVDGSNTIHGSFYDNGTGTAGETTGVFANSATSPAPRDGVSPNEDNRRGYVNIRGVYNAKQ